MISAIGTTACVLLVVALVGREAVALGAFPGRDGTRRTLNASIVVLSGLMAVAVAARVAELL